jgi:signal transduction histidine kinase
MRPANFIVDNLDLILTRWHHLTGNALAAGSGARHELPEQMLKSISATMMAARIAGPDQVARRPQDGGASQDSAAALYGAERLLAGSTIDQLVAEFQTLRASVLRLWLEQAARPAASDMEDMILLSDAIDQAQTEAVARFAALTRHSQQLFLAILGHDLRNPLNTTVMAASLLMRAPGIAAGHAEVAARAHRSGLRMGRLVEDLIDYTRTNLGSALPMTLSKGDMGTICRGTMDELRLANPQRAFQYDQDDDLDGVWDESRLAQVFSNLLGNALQHGARAEPISMRVESGGSNITVTIHNGGRPIEAQALASIFDPLVRFADPRMSRDGADSGLGIGLYIARAIVEAHGGEIRVASAEPGGTTFTVRLPRLPGERPVRH